MLGRTDVYTCTGNCRHGESGGSESVCLHDTPGESLHGSSFVRRDIVKLMQNDSLHETTLPNPPAWLTPCTWSLTKTVSVGLSVHNGGNVLPSGRLARASARAES